MWQINETTKQNQVKFMNAHETPANVGEQKEKEAVPPDFENLP